MTTLQEMYASLGIDAQVLAFGEHILENLKDRFAAIDETAEYNQLKVNIKVKLVVFGKRLWSS